MAEADRDRAETGIEALIHSILRIVGRRTARSIRAVGSRAIATLDYDEPEGNERRREKVDDSPRCHVWAADIGEEVSVNRLVLKGADCS